MRGALLLLVMSASGCVGVLSRSDGEGPLSPSLTRDVGSFAEVGGGEGGVLLEEKGTTKRPLLATGDSSRRLVFADGRPVSVVGAQISGGAVYRLSGDTVERRSLEGHRLGAPSVVARVPDARAFAVSSGTLAVVRPGEVLSGQGSLTPLWQGDAYKIVTLRPRDPGLLESTSGREVRLRVAPVPAHGTQRVRVRYVEPVTVEAGAGRYVLPLASEGAKASIVGQRDRGRRRCVAPAVSGVRSRGGARPPGASARPGRAGRAAVAGRP